MVCVMFKGKLSGRKQTDEAEQVDKDQITMWRTVGGVTRARKELLGNSESLTGGADHGCVQIFQPTN